MQGQEKMRYKIEYFKILNPPDIKGIINFINSTQNFFQVIDTKNVYSEIEIESAMLRADRKRSSSRVREPGILLLLYLGFTDQISVAISRTGISPETDHCAVVAGNSEDIKDFEREFPYFIRENRTIPIDTNNDDIFEKMSYVDTLI